VWVAWMAVVNNAAVYGVHASDVGDDARIVVIAINQQSG
jgi:hypothetical protein